MRILILTTLYPNPYGPFRCPFNREQFRSLARGHEVAVISPIAWTEEISGRWKGRERLPTGRRVVADDISIDYPRYLYPPKVFRSRYGRFFRRSAQAAFNRALRDFKPDVVLGSWAYPDGWAAVQLAHEAGLPAAVKVHGCDILHGGKGIENAPGRYQGTTDALKSADAVVAVSQDLARKAVSLGADPGRVHVVYNGIDVSTFHPGSRTEARTRLGIQTTGPVLLFIGSLVPVKGLETLVTACGELAAKTPINCYLVGDGPLRTALQEQIRKLGVADRIQLVGPRPHGQLPDWYRAADLFVLPSHSEGVPNVLLEATACGTPFVATRVGGIPEIAKKVGGRLVPPGDPSALAAAIALSLREPAPVTARGTLTSWDASAESLAGVLQSVALDRSRF